MKPADEPNDLCENTNIKKRKKKKEKGIVGSLEFSRKILRFNVGSGRAGKFPRFQYQGLHPLLSRDSLH